MLLVLVIGVGYLAGKQKTVNESADTASVVGTVIGFGQQMQKVSLLAPKTEFEVAVDQAYGRFASPEIIAQWKLNPDAAPGKKTSSPWPQDIEVLTYVAQADGSFVVTGNVNEMTSTGPAGKYPVTLTLQKIKGTWLITSFTRDAVAPVTGATTTNATSTQ